MSGIHSETLLAMHTVRLKKVFVQEPGMFIDKLVNSSAEQVIVIGLVLI